MRKTQKQHQSAAQHQSNDHRCFIHSSRNEQVTLVSILTEPDGLAVVRTWWHFTTTWTLISLPVSRCHFQGSSIVVLPEHRVHDHTTGMCSKYSITVLWQRTERSPITSWFLCSEPGCCFCWAFSCCSSFWISCWKKSLSCSRSTACS